MLISGRNLCAEGLQQIRDGVRLLRIAAPRHYRQANAELRLIEYRPRGCYGALACTGAHLGRTAVLAYDPAQADVVDIAVSISHEARHHYTDPLGKHRILLHVCDDCSDPWERAQDAIYREDMRLRRILEASPWARLVSYTW